MKALVVIMINVGVDLLSGIARQIVVFRQVAVLEGLVPALHCPRGDLALSLRMIGCVADMVHLLAFVPVGQFVRYVACAVVQ